VTPCSKAILSFIKLLDLDLEQLFSCPHCKQLAHEQLTLIMDGKCMGMQRLMFHHYHPPRADDERAPAAW
jgi:hypothetical protein